MKHVLPLLLLASLSATETADTVVIRGLPTDPGDYYVLIRRADDGAITVYQLPVATLSAADPAVSPSPAPSVPQAAADFSQLRRAVSEATKAIEDENASEAITKLATLYRSATTLPWQNRESLQAGTDAMFASLNLPEPWKDWKLSIDKALSSHVDLDESRRAWITVAEVLEVSK